MAVISVDVGGTKISGGLFNRTGMAGERKKWLIGSRQGNETAELISWMVAELMKDAQATGEKITSVGLCVPGIVRLNTGTVWAPNIPGWDDFPLIGFLQENFPDAGITFFAGSDRSCQILGEAWKGAARGCANAVVIAVGTGIGAGIMSDGHVLHGHGDIAGATGWMALETPFKPEFTACGNFEYYASGNGIGARARDMLSSLPDYKGHMLTGKKIEDITAHDVFSHYPGGDPVAVAVIRKVISLWGMAAANFVSLFNPEKIVWSGGIFGPATVFLDDIYREALLWAQPVSIRQVTFVAAELGEDAGLYGAARLAMMNEKEI